MTETHSTADDEDPKVHHDAEETPQSPTDTHLFTTTVRWTFAKTMPDWPHEYTIRSWRPEAHDEFTWFCQLIEDRGVVKAWPPAPEEPIYHNTYLVIGDWEYWAMGPLGDRDPVEDKTVINRALVRV